MPSIFFLSLMNGAAWGGSEELWYRTALRACEKGWTVACAVYDWPEKNARLNVLENKGARIYRLPNPNAHAKNFPGKIRAKLVKKWLLPKAIAALPLEDYEVTLISQGEFENTHRAWKEFYRRLGKFSTIYHNYREGQVLKPETAAIMQNWMDKASKNLFASRRIMEVLRDLSGITINNGELVYNPTSFLPPENTTTFPPLREGNYVFTMLAALDMKRKAQDQLIRALASEQWRERNWQLDLYGSGADHDLLKKLVTDLSLQDKVFLRGHSSDIEQILRESHVLLQLTHVDAMPLSVVEAMSLSRPVIVSRIGDMPAWVMDGENGWISEDASVGAITDVLEKAWSHKEHWPAMGKKSFEIFKSKYPESPEEDLLRTILE